MSSANQQPEQAARDRIDAQLQQAGWVLQSKFEFNVHAAPGVAAREVQTADGPADYVLFIDGKPCGVIEAKRPEEGHRLTVHEDQTTGYRVAGIKLLDFKEPLRFGYEATGEIIDFVDTAAPQARSRRLFHFQRPETLRALLKAPHTLRARLQHFPPLDTTGLRDCQTAAITSLENSFGESRPRALIHMATGAGKTFTAITSVYRLLKHTDAKRILFLVDTRNLGEQAEQEFMAYRPNDENRNFTDLYKVQRLTSRFIAPDARVCISTIQRMYAILKGEELDPIDETTNPNERPLAREPVPVAYNPAVPIEQFDFLVIDECHRSIYNLWRQVLDYFDAFQIGLTATPDQRTFGYFNENIVSEYPYEQSVTDGVNVGFDIYRIRTEIGTNGAVIESEDGYVAVREKLTRKQRWQAQDDDIAYTAKRLNKDVVNKSQIRTVVQTFRERLPTLFPGRAETDGVPEVPKTLVFAKDDSHADDIVRIIREVFNGSNDFCKKITYKSEQDPKSVLSELRNDYYPRIAVTVDMIATGTDVKPLECLLFLRDVRSRNYFEQMKGRGCRSLKADDLRKVTPTATLGKASFVLVDAVGVTESLKTDSRPLEQQRGVSMGELLQAVALGRTDEETLTSLAGRLARLNAQLPEARRDDFTQLANGTDLATLSGNLLAAHNDDRIDQLAREQHNLPQNTEPDADQRDQAQQDLIRQAVSALTPKAREYIETARRDLDQILDTQNLDRVIDQGWDEETAADAEQAVADFDTYLRQHKDEITALKIFYDQPWRLRELTFEMVRAVLTRLMNDRPNLAPVRIWSAYRQLEERPPASPKSELVALVSLLRRVVGLDEQLTDFDALVRQRFQDWVFKRHAGKGEKFTEEQMNWLQMLRDHIASSFHVAKDDLDLSPFDAQGGLAKFYQLFGTGYEAVLDELNERLVA